jgi:DNA-binding transcriptional LysR family regulator
MKPELRHLRYFVAAAEELSFSGAARRMFVSQQSLSRTIGQLEERLGARVFERGPRALALTPAGEALLAPARRTLAAADEAFSAARGAFSDGAPPLRVDISSGGIETGALILRRLRSDDPEVRIEQFEVGLPRGFEMLRSQELDVLLGLATDRPQDLRAEPIREEQVLVGLSADHPLAAYAEVPVPLLADQALLLPSDRAAPEWNRFVEQICREAGFRPQRFPGVTHGSVSAAEIVREGRCVVPTMAWTNPPEGLSFRPLTDPRPTFTWSMIWLPEVEHRDQLSAFLSTARALSREREWLPPKPERRSMKGEPCPNRPVPPRLPTRSPKP